jgi:hypothetical protein
MLLLFTVYMMKLLSTSLECCFTRGPALESAMEKGFVDVLPGASTQGLVRQISDTAGLTRNRLH